MRMLLLFAAALGLAWWLLTPVERARLVEAVARIAARLRAFVIGWHASLEPFRASLRERTRVAVLVPLSAATCVIVFFLAAAAPGPLSDPATLIAWGANYGPETTRGGWWRIASSAWVHAGLVALIVHAVALVQAGAIVERLLGPLAFAVIYVGAAAAAGVADLATAPVGVHAGASGAIAGLYGAVLAAWACGLRRESPPIPARALGWLAPVAAVVAMVDLGGGPEGRSDELAGLAAGVLLGIVFGRDADARKPSPRRLAAAAASVIVAGAVALWAIGDVSDARPALARLVAAEASTAAAYERAVRRFREGGLDEAALARLIDRTILVELRAAAAPVRALEGVPREHRRLVAAAERYIDLRDRSWRVRAGGLRRSSFALLREADRLERAALEALEPLRAGPTASSPDDTRTARRHPSPPG